MKARLDGLFSIDLPAGPLQLPKDPRDCWIVVQADIGPLNNNSADTFTFYVCTLKNLQQLLDCESYRLGHHLILVERFDWKVVEDAIGSILDKLDADNWDQLAAKINEYGEWEFNDYDHKPVL